MEEIYAELLKEKLKDEFFDKEDYSTLSFIISKLIKIYESNNLQKYNDDILAICLEIQQIQLKMLVEEEKQYGN